MKWKRVISFWLPPVLWAALIFKLSSGSLPVVGETYWGDFAFKKFSHVIFYGILAVLVYRALRSRKINNLKSLYLSIIVAFLYGISDEIHQSFVPGRGPHFRDVIFDTIGAGISVYLVKTILERFPKWEEKFL